MGQGQAWGYWVGCVLIWGTTWLAIKEGLAVLPLFWSIALRFLLAAVVLAALAAVFDKGVRLDRRVWGGMVAVGLVFFVGEYAFVYWGEQFLRSGVTAVVFGTTPFFIGLFEYLTQRVRWTGTQALAAVVSFGGVALLGLRDPTHGSQEAWGIVAVLLSAVAAAWGTILIRRHARSTPVFTLNAGAMAIAGVVLTGISLVAEERPALPQGTVAWASVLYLSLLGSVVAFVLYARLLRVWTASRSGTLVFVVPIVALLVGAVVRHERLDRVDAAGIAAVLGGVILFLRARSPPAGVPEPEPATSPTEG